MDYIMKHKMLFWLIVLLVILNLVTMTAVWFGRPPYLGHMQRQMDGPMQAKGRGLDVMKDKLQLTDKQAEKFEQLRYDHFERTKVANDAAAELRLEILNDIFDNNVNQDKINEKLSILKELQGKFDSLLFQHFSELKVECTKEQQKKLKQMFSNLLVSMPRGGLGPKESGMGLGQRTFPPPDDMPFPPPMRR